MAADYREVHCLILTSRRTRGCPRHHLLLRVGGCLARFHGQRAGELLLRGGRGCERRTAGAPGGGGGGGVTEGEGHG